jgi:hypothetical protein
MKAAALLLFAALLLGGALPTTAFRYSAPIQTTEGWNLLDLPNDVLDGCRAGLADLRMVDDTGNEVAFAFEPAQESAKRRLSLQDVETVPRVHTVVLVDRGADAPAANRVDLEIADSSFLKPVVLEASPDRVSWAQIAHGSVFRTASATSTSLGFPANDRRWWRVRMDDRNGEVVTLNSVTVWQAQSKLPASEIPLAVRELPAATGESSTWVVTLPAANLSLSAIRLTASDAAFQRRVRIYERVFVRDEVNRELLGEGILYRGVDLQDRVAVRPASSKTLEIEVESSGGLALHVTGASAQMEPRRLMFHADAGRRLSLMYGSPSVQAPHYDLDEALLRGLPGPLHTAHLGARSPTGHLPESVSAPARGAEIDAAAWRHRHDILLPATGTVAWIDLDLPASELPSLRIADASGHQVPYLLESAPRLRTSPAALKVRNEDTKTIVQIDGASKRASVTAVELMANGPDYFQRQVQLREVALDQRGRAGSRWLGSAGWNKQPNEPFSPLRIPIARPAADTIEAELDNGDNAPVQVSSIALVWELRRVDFVFEPGDKLQLLYGNPTAASARYDLGLVAQRVLSSPAEMARLGPLIERPSAGNAVPRWFWVFVVAAALLVMLALVRTLKGETKG